MIKRFCHTHDLQIETVLYHQHFSTWIFGNFEPQKMIFWRFQKVPHDYSDFECLHNASVIYKVELESTFSKLRFPIFAFLNFLFEVWKYMLGLHCVGKNNSSLIDMDEIWLNQFVSVKVDFTSLLV